MTDELSPGGVTPPTLCAADGCPDPVIPTGTLYLRYSKLDANIHIKCADTRTVQGEDVSDYFVGFGNRSEDV
jgi:hypothetical protein